MYLYPWLKHLHVTAVVITASLFLLRLYWSYRRPEFMTKRWVRTLPHVNDSVLLIAGLSMAYLIKQYPFTSAWLTAKFTALLMYIVFGSLALKRARTTAVKAFASVVALACLAYIVGVGLSRSPYVLF